MRRLFYFWGIKSLSPSSYVVLFNHGGNPLFSYPDFCDFRDRNQLLSGVAASNPVARTAHIAPRLPPVFAGVRWS